VLPNLAGRRLLLRAAPVLRSGPFVAPSARRRTTFAVRIAGDLDETVLAIQGPPGAGKTYTGAQMIRALVAQGRRVRGHGDRSKGHPHCWRRWSKPGRYARRPQV
jgi:uncharacterized protein